MGEDEKAYDKKTRNLLVHIDPKYFRPTEERKLVLCQDKVQVVRTEITTGINDGTTVEVKSGVSNRETII